MSETVVEDFEFRSALFSDEPYGSEGEASGLPSLAEVGLDLDLQHAYWSAHQAGRRLVGEEVDMSPGISSYGYTVYRDLLEEPVVPDAVYLDPRVFFPETDLADVLEEATKNAIDYERPELVLPLIKGLIDTVATDLLATEKVRKAQATILRSGNGDAIRLYVDFINNHTLQTDKRSRVVLKDMAHAIAALPASRRLEAVGEVYWVDKQVLLEDVAHAWVRKRMPLAEIDWLP